MATTDGVVAALIGGEGVSVGAAGSEWQLWYLEALVTKHEASTRKRKAHVRGHTQEQSLPKEREVRKNGKTRQELSGWAMRTTFATRCQKSREAQGRCKATCRKRTETKQEHYDVLPWFALGRLVGGGSCVGERFAVDRVVGRVVAPPLSRFCFRGVAGAFVEESSPPLASSFSFVGPLRSGCDPSAFSTSAVLSVLTLLLTVDMCLSR